MSEIEKTDHEKEYVIVVNGEKRVVDDDTVTFDQLVTLAYPSQSSSSDFTITFRGAQKPKEGSLKPGGAVRVKKEGAIFNVTSTTKS